MSQEWIWQQPYTVKKANERTGRYEQQYNWQDSKHFPYALSRISGDSNNTMCSDLSAIHKSKWICLEIFQNTETDLENMIYRKDWKDWDCLTKKRRKENERGRGTKERFYKQKKLFQTEEKKLFFLSCGEYMQR